MSDFPERLGRYRLLHRLGSGGMGEVFHAILEGPQGFRKPVALKVLPAGKPPSSLVHEARLGAMLSHPHVVSIYELGSFEDRWFISMELVNGPTVSQLMRDGPLAPAHVVEIGLQVAAGLAHIHGLQVNGQNAGLVHRDIKGSNLLLDKSGLIKIADLGIARLVGTGAVVAGTPSHMAPEQLDGEEDQRADLFSVGVLLYSMATGKLPFGKGRSALMRTVAADTLLADRAFLAPVEERVPGLGAVLRRCLPVHAIDRYESATALHNALRALRVSIAPGKPLYSLVEGADSVAPAGETSTPMLSEEPTRLMAAGHLPKSADRFVGREDEQKELELLLRDHRLITLLGPGGMGKTRLSLEVARRTERSFRGGSWFCDLSEASSSLGICAAVAPVLEIPIDSEDPVTQIGHALAGRGPLLLLLDNLEQVIADSQKVIATWRRLAPEVTILCTSQIPLRIPGEKVQHLGPISLSSGSNLFYARAARPPGEEERSVVEELVQALDGLPLAIELAAARTRVMSVSRVLDHLKDRFRVLAGGGAHRPARHRSLLASLDTSFELLPKWGPMAMGQLAVCRDGFTLEAAEAILDLSEWPDSPWALDLVDTLVEHSLIRFDAQVDRFRMLQTIQAYAIKKVQGPALRAAEVRHGQWFAQLGAQDSLKTLAAHGGSLRWAKLEAEVENLVIASRRAVLRADLPVASQTARAAWEVLTLKGPIAVGSDLMQQVLTLPGADQCFELRYQYLRSKEHQGQLKETEPLMKGLLAEAQLAKHPIAPVILGSLVRLLGDMGETHEAMALSTEELKVARSGGDRALLAGALRRRANLLRVLGHFQEALDTAREALPLYRYLGDQRGEAISLGNMGTMLELTGHIDEARQVYEQALHLHRAAKDRRNEGSVLSNLGSLALGLGRNAEAQRVLLASISLHREVGNRHDESIAMGNLGLTYFVQGDHINAQRLLEQAAHMARACGNRTVATIFDANLGGLLRLNGDPERALKTLNGILPAALDIGDLRLIGFIEGELGATHLELLDFPAAKEVLVSGEAHLRETGDLLELAKLLTTTAELWGLSGKEKRAREVLLEAESLAAKLTVADDSVLGKRITVVRELLGD